MRFSIGTRLSSWVSISSQVAQTVASMSDLLASPLAGSELEPNDIVDSFVAALTAEARWTVN